MVAGSGGSVSVYGQFFSMPHKNEAGDYTCMLRLYPYAGMSVAQVSTAVYAELHFIAVHNPGLNLLGRATNLREPEADQSGSLLEVTLPPERIDLLLYWMQRSNLRLFRSNGQPDTMNNAVELRLEFL